jgi:outer membrane protein assembly factor BamB
MRLLHLLAVGLFTWGVTVSGSSTASSTAQGSTNWPMEHFDAGRSGVNPFETILNAGNVDQLVQDWSQPIGNRRVFSESVALAVWGGMVFAGSPHALSTFDAESGELIWRRRFGIDATPAVVDGVVYMGGSNWGNPPQSVVALSAATGATLWRFGTGWTVESSPAVVDGVVYVGSEDGYMYALDAVSGQVIWAQQLWEGLTVMSTPTVAQGIVYVSTGELHALDAATGVPIWQSSCHGGLNAGVGVTVVGGVVYAASFPGFVAYVCAWDAATGQLIWDVNVEYGVSDLVTDGHTLYGVSDRTLFALDADSGIEVWHQDTGGSLTYLSLANGVLYVGGFGYPDSTNYSDVSAFDQVTGSLLWSQTLSAGRNVAIPAIVDGRLYLAAEDDSVFAFALP